MSGQKYASQASEDMKEGTGLFDNVNAKITGIRFTKTPPSDTYGADGNPIFGEVKFLIDGDGPAEDRSASQSYSLGASAGDNFDISADGYGLIPKTEDATLRKDSKWGTLLTSLAKEGLPKPILQAGDMSKVVNLYGHFKRVADRERSFAESKQRKSKFPPSTLVCTKILSLPGASGAAGSSPSATTANTAPSGDVDTRAGAYLAQVVKAKGGKVQRSQLTLLISTAAKAEADKNDIVKRAISEEFLVAINEAGGVVDAAGDVVALVYDQTAKPQVVRIAA